MNRTFLLLIAAGGLLAAGCIPLSIHPIYTDADLVFEPALVGSFGDGEEIWEFEQKDERSYVLTVTEADEESPHYQVRLAKVGDLLLMDFYPEPSAAKVDEYLGTLLMPLHTFAVAESIEPDLVLKTLDMRVIEKLLAKDPAALKHEIVDDAMIITASPKELQAFVQEFADNDSVWERTVLERPE